MSEKHLHIVSFDIPSPPSYGGVIDVFFKIRALQEEGVRIHLHCFEYGRSRDPALDRMCATVNYYKRRSGTGFVFNALPYIVSTRSSAELLAKLQGDRHPVLFEGLHCCYYLQADYLPGRTRIVRSHNIEHEYYAALARVEKKFFRRSYFSRESKKLERFEKVYERADRIAAISPADAAQLASRYTNVSCIPAFHPDEQVRVKPGRGDYALYHGNMAVGENNEAALFLVRNIFRGLDIPLYIAGSNPSEELVSEAAKHAHVRLFADLSLEQMHDMVRNAQVNILPTFQSTGIKLKLLAALHNGRHCLVNPPMVMNTGLEALCVVRDTAQEMADELKRLFDTPFDPAEVKKREEILQRDFSNKANAKRLVELIWNR
ncbi:MAG: hypothetical protein AB1458_08665 [Bacteroidota bacterium]